MDYTGYSKLAGVLHNRMSETAETKPVLDFGQINADGSLTTNLYPITIPASDYLVCRCAAHKEAVLTTTQTGQGTHPHGPSGAHAGHTTGDGTHSHPSDEGAHDHDVLLPSSMAAIKSGDRVLVAWVGNDAVVIDVIVAASGVV